MCLLQAHYTSFKPSIRAYYINNGNKTKKKKEAKFISTLTKKDFGALIASHTRDNCFKFQGKAQVLS